MKTRVLFLVVCAMFSSGTGFAALTADPNILNASFEDPTVSSAMASVNYVTDWFEASTTDARTQTRLEGTGNVLLTPHGYNLAGMLYPGSCIYQPVATFSSNTVYDVSLYVGKRNDQPGPVVHVELWAGGDPGLAADSAVNDRIGGNFELETVVGAALVDAAMLDFSQWGNTWPNPGQQNVQLLTETSHTTSDVLWLVIYRGNADTGGAAAGGQLYVDNVSMSFLADPFPVLPDDGATGVPVTTDANPSDPNYTTLVWLGPGTYDSVGGFDVYIGTTDPNFLLDPPYGLETTLVTGTSNLCADPSPSSDLDYETTYHWVVVAHEPNTVGTIPHPVSSSFTTISEDIPPVVTITQNGARTWPGAPSISLDATVTDAEAITNVDWSVTGVPATYADYLGDPNQFIISEGGTLENPTAVFAMNLTDPNALGYYQVTLTATDAGDPGATPPNEALEGSDTAWFEVLATPCLTFQANGGWLNPFDMNDDCVLDINDLTVWAAEWMDDRNPLNPYYYGWTP